jgi:hypothetical protein
MTSDEKMMEQEKKMELEKAIKDAVKKAKRGLFSYC